MLREFSLEIHFPVSRSKNYQNVLKNARLFFDFTEHPNILRITDIDELVGRWDNFSIVIFGATQWSGTNVFFCGNPVIPYRNEFFYKLLDLRHCYNAMKGSYERDGYCKASDWGCRKLTQYSRTISGPYANYCFYKIGKFKDPKTWIIDKERLVKLLEIEAEIRLVDVCPAFWLGNIQNAVNSLVDEIRINDNWQVTYKTEIGTNGPVKVPASIDYIDPEEPYTEPTPRRGLTFSISSRDESDEQGKDDGQKSIDDFLDDLLEKRKKKDDETWEETSF